MADNNLIWFDSLTPKQSMLFISIGKKLEKLGFEVLFTTRKHDYIQDIFKAQNIDPVIFGEYGGKSLEEKLTASIKRMMELTNYIINLKNKPLAAICFSSPDASRIAFGLGIPLILLNDTAHSKPVGKLTFSLCDYLIKPSCIPNEVFIELGASPKKVVNYEGVDEVEYIQGENIEQFKKLREKALKDDDLYLVYRPEESFAAYMKDKDSKAYFEILEEIILNYNKKIIVLPRYPQQKKLISEKFGDKVVIPDKGLYFMDLLSKAEIVITGGGTIAREAALLGIPSITYFWRHLEPQKFIEDKGFPSNSIQSIDGAKKLIRKLCKNPQQHFVDTTDIIKQLKKPSDVLLPLLKKDERLKKYFSKN